jgi:hypothetical protein
VSNYDETIEKLDLWIGKFEPSSAWYEATFIALSAAVLGLGGFFGAGIVSGGVGALPGAAIGASKGAIFATMVLIALDGTDGSFVDPDKYENGGPQNKGSKWLNRWFYTGLVAAKKLLEEAEEDKVEAITIANEIINEAYKYHNNKAADEFSTIPQELWDDVFVEKSLETSKYIASYALRALAMHRDKMPNDAAKAITKFAMQSLNDGQFLPNFALRSIPQIATAINLHPFSDAKKKISLGVRDQIREGASDVEKIAKSKQIQITINPPEGDKLFQLLRGSNTGDSRWFIVPSKFQGDAQNISTKVLTDEMIDKKKLRADVIQWPKEAIGDPVDDDFKKSLQNFDEINETTDLTTYKFKYWTHQQSSTIEWLSEFGSPSTEDLVLNNLSNAYLNYIIEVFKASQGLTVEVGETTVGGLFNKHFLTENLIRLVYGYIAVDKEIARRIAFFKKVAEIEASRPEGEKENPLTDEELKRAEQAGLDGFASGDADTIQTEALDENAVKNMQKFYKQCALMMNISTLRDDYKDEIKKRYTDIAYDGRFYVIKSGGDEPNQETILTKLVSSKHQQKLFELEPWQVSSLTPKLRLFKILETGNGDTKEVEFEFERTSITDRQKVKGPDYTSAATTFMGSDFDKGNGVGVKEFSIEFAGTNPAESRNDIKATLKLFFQSFMDFIRYRKPQGGTDADVYRYADLVIQPKPNKNSTTAYGQDVTNKRAYDAAFYRIRADLGYYVPDYADKDLKDAIDHQNKSFMLTMVDHDISFNKDGSVTISIEYRAYLESLLKMPRLDALASPELIQKRQENATKLAEELLKGECSVEQIRELQISLQSQEEAIAQKSLRSIMNRLEERGVIYNVKVKDEDRTFFLNNGYFQKCGFDTYNQEENGEETDLGKVLSQELPEDSSGFDFMDTKDSLIQYFYFGDLLYTILDCAFDDDNFPRDGMANNRIILGSFEFDSFASESTGGSVYGIDQMPISVDFFSRWFVDNVISQKNTRKTFPVLNFIRQLSNSLIRKSLIENCVNKKMDKSLRFQTGQITAYGPDGDPMDYIAHNSFYNGNPVINVDEYRTDGGLLPLKGSPSEKSEDGSYWNYIVLSSMGSTLSYSGKGVYEDDVEQGRFHVQIGQKSGMVKTISLSKTSQSYLKEARFFQNGIDGILQLSNVYVATVEMFGNTIFYPGMEFFFNPYGLGGGTEFGIPQDKGSIAWKMGIGGYHTILSVKTTLTPGKFSTTIKGQQYYSGDGSGNSDLETRRKDGQTSIEEYKPWWDWAGLGEFEVAVEACNKTISSVQFGSVEEAEAGPTGSPAASGATPAPVEVSTPETQTEPPTSEQPPISTERIEDPEAESDNSIAGTSNEQLRESNGDEETVVVTAESTSEPEIVDTIYGGQLRTVTSSSTSTSQFGTTSSQQATLTGGQFEETNKGNVYFRPYVLGDTGFQGLGERVLVTDLSRIVR